MPRVSPGRPLLLIFREVLPGDIKKQFAQSNIAKSGGGARDLRFRNVKDWAPFFGRLFTIPSAKKGVAKGRVYWLDSAGRARSVDIECWRPTKARPNELRLGKIHLIGGWVVDEATYTASHEKGEKWFYCLFLDDRNRLWAKLLTKDLTEELVAARDYVQRRIKETRAGATVYGAISLADLHQTLETGLSEEQAKVLTRVTATDESSAESLEAVDEVTRGRKLEGIVEEWRKRNADKTPEEIERRVRRLKRCYGVVRSLKKKYGYKCQIGSCRFTFRMRNGGWYCEAAHIKPLRGRKRGLDLPENILILCANHHKMLDYGPMKVISPTEVEIDGTRHRIMR